MIPDNKQEKNTASKTGSYSSDACGHASIYIYIFQSIGK